MTVSKLTNPPSQKGVIDKINEVIDNLGGGGSAPVWGNITGTLSDQTDLQNELNNKINKQDPVTPLGFNSKQAVTVNANTGVVRINPIGFLSGKTEFFPNISYDTIFVPTTKKGNRILDTTQVLMYSGSLDGTTITFPSQFTRNTVGARVIIGNLNNGIFTPYIWVDDTTLYTGNNLNTGSMVLAGVPVTAYMGGVGFTPSTTTSSDTTNSISIFDHSGDAEVVAILQVDADPTANRNLFDTQTTIPTEDLNCVVFGLLTGNNLYYASDFSIDNQSGNVWVPSSTVLREYLTLSIGAGLSVGSGGQLIAVDQYPDYSSAISFTFSPSNSYTAPYNGYISLITNRASDYISNVKVNGQVITGSLAYYTNIPYIFPVSSGDVVSTDYDSFSGTSTSELTFNAIFIPIKGVIN